MTNSTAAPLNSRRAPLATTKASSGNEVVTCGAPPETSALYHRAGNYLNGGGIRLFPGTMADAISRPCSASNALFITRPSLPPICFPQKPLMPRMRLRVPRDAVLTAVYKMPNEND